jgi:hypothetical protein
MNRLEKRQLKTVKFVIYCYEKSKPGKEEGTITMTDKRGLLVRSNQTHHFDSYDELGKFLRDDMAQRVSSPR